VLELAGVTRSFGSLKALDDVSFEVAPGRLTGFVGANGAGKTTAMRIVMGVLSSDSGQVLLNGQPVTAAVATTFGYMPEERGLYPKLGVREQLIYFARLHGLQRRQAESNADALLEQLGLGARAGDKVEKLSLGNQQRAQIAAALVHDPQLLILDEPFSGLDPIAVDTVMGVLREYANKGAPILFSSHQLDVVERITDDLVIIAAGTIKAAGPTSDLQNEYAGSRYRLVLGWPSSQLDGQLVASPDVSWINATQGVDQVTVTQMFAGSSVAETGCEVLFDATAEAAQTVLTAALSRGPVEAFGRLMPPLSEVFKEVVA
jgi:ABC-2 type transport system ATP-binding protein